MVTFQECIELTRSQSEIRHVELEQETVKEELFCAICMDDVIENELISKLRCLHRFHNPCLQDWMKIKQICPICKITL